MFAVLELMIFLPLFSKFNRLALSFARADDVANLLAVCVLRVVNFKRALLDEFVVAQFFILLVG